MKWDPVLLSALLLYASVPLQLAFSESATANGANVQAGYGTLPTFTVDNAISVWYDTRAFPSLSAANDCAVANGKILLVSTATTVSGNTTLSAPVMVVKGGSFTVVPGKKLDINGQFQAGLYQCFHGAGDVVFGPGKTTVAYPEWWGAETVSGSHPATGTAQGTRNAAAIVAATKSMSSAYESGKTVIFQSGIYQVSRRMSFTAANASMVTWRSAGRTTIFCDQPDGDFALDIDFTSGSANFVTFNMSNIVFSDIFARRTKKGIKATRLIASNWTGCEFNYLSVAVDFQSDSNLNHLDTCSFRENRIGWYSSTGSANSNVFTNCLWRYHYGTAFDSTGTGGNQIIGGDFEPNNAAPAIIADDLILAGTRIERNTADKAVIRVRNHSNIDVDLHCDGGTQYLPAIQVEGSSNTITLRRAMATQAVNCLPSSSRNRIYLGSFIALVDFSYIVDRGTKNVFYTSGSMQSDQAIVEAVTDRLLPTDPRVWKTTNCTVTLTDKASGTYTVMATGGMATLTYSLKGKYSGIAVAATIQAKNAGGQVLWKVNNNIPGVSYIAYDGDAPKRSVSVTSNYRGASLTDPVVGFQMAGDAAGSAFTIRDIRSSTGGIFPD